MASVADAAAELRAARSRAGLTEQRLARLAGTTAATLSAYESGRKHPTAATLARLLAACGARLEIMPAPPRPTSHAELRHAGEQLAAVIALAEQLPFAPPSELRFPRLPNPRTR